MPKGPKGEKRPADVIGAAILVGRIATGDADDKPSKAPKRAVVASSVVRHGQKPSRQNKGRPFLLEPPKLVGRKFDDAVIFDCFCDSRLL